MYDKLIQKYIDALTKEPNKDSRKYNILNILNNVGAIFISTCFHHRDVPKETIFERGITDRNKLRKGRLKKIKTKEQNVKVTKL